MKATIVITCEDLEQDDLLALLQAVRRVEHVRMPDKVVRMTIDTTPPLTLTDVALLLAKVRPPFVVMEMFPNRPKPGSAN